MSGLEPKATIASLAPVRLRNVEPHTTDRPPKLIGKIPVAPRDDLNDWTNELDNANDTVEQLDPERVVHDHHRRN